MAKLKVRRINVNGKLPPGVYAKDVILHLIRKLGVNGGVGYAYEYGGSAFDALDLDGRMTVCNMSIEGGARAGYVNPDATTFAYLQGRPHAPKDGEWKKAVARWKEVASDPDARYDDVVSFQAGEICPTVTWGLNPGQALGIDEKIPAPEDLPADQHAAAKEALAHMRLKPGAPIAGVKVDVCFIGSCTNGRISDLREAARYVKGRKVAAGVKALVVPGSEAVRRQAEAEGLDRVFRDAGFEWRLSGCSMCLAMNPDKLVGEQLCAATSNRNFKCRMGSPILCGNGSFTR
jgi:3-isopropylmalate/(R)-2-methylmalate dehydratase large subunit